MTADLAAAERLLKIMEDRPPGLHYSGQLLIADILTICRAVQQRELDVQGAAEECVRRDGRLKLDGRNWNVEEFAAILRRRFGREEEPWDDDAHNAIDEAWLRSVGFTDDRMGCPTLGPLHIQATDFQKPGKDTVYPAYACIRSVPIPVPKTRRDLRLLARALGIELREGGK